MSTVAWKRLLLALCAFALIQQGAVMWIVTQSTHPGTRLVNSSPFRFNGHRGGEPFVHRVIVNQKTGGAYLAGLRTGDIVDLRPLSPAERYRWITFSNWPGEVVSIPVVRDGTLHLTTIVGHPRRWDLAFALSEFGGVWMVLFAALIAWRRAAIAEARTLSMLLILINIGGWFSFNQGWVTPWPVVDAILAVVSAIVGGAGFALLATYAMLFDAGAKRFRSILAWLSYASAGAYAAYGIVYVIGVWTMSADPVQSWYTGALARIVAGVFPLLFPLLCLFATIAQVRGVERTRIAWASASLGLFYVVLLSIGVAQTFGPASPLTAYLAYFAGNLIYFIAPIGMTYSLLNRRLLDIGFAINHAAVFSAVSAIVVGTFILCEWLISNWFTSASHTTNMLIGAGLTLALGLSVRVVHARVDRVLDSVFFRKRHEDEEAIRTFAHEAAFITALPILLERTVAMLEDHADAVSVTLALDDSAGHFGDVDENDSAIVALRAGGKTLDLHTVNTALRGEFAFPMRARGRLVGVLILGPKRSGDPYAPDEKAAIASLAHRVGDALDVLAAKGHETKDSILEAIMSMNARLAAVAGDIRSLVSHER
jgi:hypothetical protein